MGRKEMQRKIIERGKEEKRKRKKNRGEQKKKRKIRNIIATE